MGVLGAARVGRSGGARARRLERTLRVVGAGERGSGGVEAVGGTGGARRSGGAEVSSVVAVGDGVRGGLAASRDGMGGAWGAVLLMTFGTTMGEGLVGPVVGGPLATAAESGAGAEDLFAGFAPVCPLSDGVFRVGQRAAVKVAGETNIEDYRPLINDVLIRVRTELCVLESFARETAIPFVREKGVGWVLPVHETPETYLAGVVFMVGANFILLGSTKIVAIMSIYHDLIVGTPVRVLGRVLDLAGGGGKRMRLERDLARLGERQVAEVQKVMRRRRGVLGLFRRGGDALGSGGNLAEIEAVNAKYAAEMDALQNAAVAAEAKARGTNAGRMGALAGSVAVPLRLYGRASSGIRSALELFDTFCSRYFVTFTVGYVAVKTVHLFILPDFP